MAKNIASQLFEGLSILEKAELFLIMLMTIAVPVDWRYGVWVLTSLCAVSVTKIIATHKVGNPALSKIGRASLVLMMLYFVIYMISIAYSCDRAEGWAEVSKKLPLLVIPAIVLCSDLSYLKPKHLTALTLLLAGTLSVRFFVMLVGAGIRYADGNPVAELIDFHFDPLHHNYLALYLIGAVALLYVQLTRHWKAASWQLMRWLTVTDMGLLTLYMVIMGSRSGLVVMFLLMAACMAHTAFVRKKRKATLIMLGAFVVFVGATYLTMPKLYWRIIYSAQQMAEGKRSDSREVLWLSGMEVLKGHEAIGLGCGGYWGRLHERYVAHDFAEGYLHEQYSTHNQYIETALAAGFVGLTVMLAMIVLPLTEAFSKGHRRNLAMVLFTLVYAGCLLFEDMFARQMGLLFICWWYSILCTIPTAETRALRSTREP